ncbi:MAG: hypothetical protein ACFFAS_12670 [Promethearchaeota archaeon]
MKPEEEGSIIADIIKQRRLPYSFEVVDVDGDKYTIRNNFGSEIVYYKKGTHYYLEEELK